VRIDPNHALRTLHASDAGDHPDRHGVVPTEHNRECVLTHGAFNDISYRAAGAENRLNVLRVTWTSRAISRCVGNLDIPEVVNGVSERLQLLSNAGCAKDLGTKSRTAPAGAELERDSNECCCARSPYSEKE
jgi:hypothetical protein